MQLKDITKEWITEQLQSKYSEFEYIDISYSHNTHAEWSLLNSETSSGVIAYLSKHANLDALSSFSTLLKVDNKKAATDALDWLYSIYNQIYNLEVKPGNLDSDDRDEYLHTGKFAGSMNVLEEVLSSHHNLIIADCYPRFTQLDDSTLRLTFVQHKFFGRPLLNDYIVQQLVVLKESLEEFLAFATERQLTHAINIYTEALAQFEIINQYFISRLVAVDIQAFSQKELHVCNFEIDAPEFSETLAKFDNVRKLKISEVLDPMSAERLIRPIKGTIKDLTDLCDTTIVRNTRLKDGSQENVMTEQEAIQYCYRHVKLRNHTTISQLLLSKLHYRIEHAELRSHEKRVLRKFKESITPYVNQLIKIYTDAFPYILSQRMGRPAPLVVDAIRADVKNKNNAEKLRIIDELQQSLNALEQSIDSINSAYHDMLYNAYNE